MSFVKPTSESAGQRLEMSVAGASAFAPAFGPGADAHVPPGPWDRWLARPMFWLCVLFLIAVGGLLHRARDGMESDPEWQIMFWSVAALWPILTVEAAARTFLCRRRMGAVRFLYFLLFVLFPPARLGARSYADEERMWLPTLGWVGVDKVLRRKLERFFSVPMIVIALMVLPVLAMEYFWFEQVESHFGWKLALDIASSVIWMAFAVEFIIMVSVAANKIRYCFQNWMDMLVVALPLIDFMPLLRLFRLTRILQVQQLSRMGRLYRLRGLVFKLWRAILVLEMVQRLLGNHKERRLKKLRELLAAREEELEDIRKEIAELEQALAIAPGAAGNDPIDDARVAAVAGEDTAGPTER